LREQIAEYLFRSRGVKCSIDQIVIGSGTQYLLLLILMLFDPGTAIAVENPGYYRANLIFKQAGMNVVPIPVKEHGVDVSEILSKEVQLVYCTPSHQFPLGMIMPIHQRQRLIQWANERDGYIIEDDYDGEFRYDGRPIPAMQGLDPFGRVIYLGTFSKSLVPSLRVNYMVLPEGLIRKFNTDLFYMKQSVSKIHQETIAYFIKEGYWEKHLNKMRTLYRRKRELLIEMLKNRFGETIEIKGEKSGLHIVVELNETSYCEEELIRLAEDAGVKVYGASVFYTGKAPKKPQILLGYGGLSQEEVVKGIDRLADAWNLYNTNNI
jgi:GntR family transcriptional regulator/MocR family aminotransferase